MPTMPVSAVSLRLPMLWITFPWIRMFFPPMLLDQMADQRVFLMSKPLMTQYAAAPPRAMYEWQSDWPSRTAPPLLAACKVIHAPAEPEELMDAAMESCPPGQP